jgi:hypothetical protein
MKKIILAIMVLMIIGSNVFANDEFSVDGQKWKNWNENSKSLFLWGWIKCGESAYNNVMMNLSKESSHAKIQHKQYIDAGVIIGGLSIRQLMNTLDSIYSDTRLTYIDIEKVMPFVIGRLHSGWTLEQLDKAISYQIRLDRCQDREKGVGVIAECSSLRKERNEYMSTLGR